VLGEKLRRNRGQFDFGDVVGERNAQNRFGKKNSARKLSDARARLGSGGGGAPCAGERLRARYARLGVRPGLPGALGWGLARAASWAGASWAGCLRARGGGGRGAGALGCRGGKLEWAAARWAERGGGREGEKGAAGPAELGQGRELG
jgi:hypothetical protein